MYINGVPGTGKTATVQRVTNKLLNESKKNELNNFKVNTASVTAFSNIVLSLLRKTFIIFS